MSVSPLGENKMRENGKQNGLEGMVRIRARLRVVIGSVETLLGSSERDDLEPTRYEFERTLGGWRDPANAARIQVAGGHKTVALGPRVILIMVLLGAKRLLEPGRHTKKPEGTKVLSKNGAS
ncbi:hypothetical protein JTB14_034683 [Gonioctena quinquepunctata]|nr:hypothetical protein JTB14_034683 [Gonioctena quinquepunctata]